MRHLEGTEIHVWVPTVTNWIVERMISARSEKVSAVWRVANKEQSACGDRQHVLQELSPAQ